MKKLIRFLSSEDGTTSVEYAVLLTLIIAMCIFAISNAGGPVQLLWGDSSNSLDTAINQ